MKAGEYQLIKILTLLESGKKPSDYMCHAFVYYDNGASRKIVSAYRSDIYTTTPAAPPIGADWEWYLLETSDVAEVVDDISYQGSLVLELLPEHTKSLKGYRRPRFFIEVVLIDLSNSDIIIKNVIDIELDDYVKSISEGLV